MGRTLTKDKRIEARADAVAHDLITRAASLSNETLSSFVVKAALEKAEVLIARADRTFMPAEQFDALIASLDDLTPVEEVVRLFAHERRIART